MSERVGVKEMVSILEWSLKRLARGFAVTLKIESSYRHALRLCEELRYVVEALVLLRKGWIMRMPLRR